MKVHSELYSVPFLFPMKCNVGLENETLGKISILDGEGNGNPLQYSRLENPMKCSGLQSMGSQRVGHD